MVDKSQYFLKDDEQEARMSICRKCENYIGIGSLCKLCMCFLPWKTRMAPASCPMSKWIHKTIINEQKKEEDFKILKYNNTYNFNSIWNYKFNMKNFSIKLVKNKEG